MSKVTKVNEIQFGNFTIRYNGLNAIAFNNNDKTILKTFKGFNSLDQAKAWIGTRHRNINLNLNSSFVSINLNSSFVSKFLEGEEWVRGKISIVNDNIFLTINTNKESTSEDGIILSVQKHKENSVPLRGNMTANQFNKLNIPNNCRYIAIEVGYNKFQLIFDSAVMSKSERIRLSVPAVMMYTY
jgi:hypothetical protein